MKKWLPAEDDFLMTLFRMRKSVVFIANRMNCTKEEVDVRIHALLHAQDNPEEKPAAPLPTAVEVEKMMEGMDPLQARFLGACQQYNGLGESFRFFGELVSATLAKEEIETLLVDCLAERKQPAETTPQFLARVLFEKAIIIPRPLKPTT